MSTSSRQSIRLAAVRAAWVTGLWGCMMLWSVWYYSQRYAVGQLLSTSRAGEYLGAVTEQTFMVCLPELLFLAGALLVWRRASLRRLSLSPGGTKVRWLTAALAVFYALCLIVQALRSGDWPTTVFRWVYYLFFIAFLEEFLFRALFPALLHGYGSERLERLLPAVLFALSHSLLPTVTGGVGAGIRAAASGLLGYTLSGLAWDWLRRRTGSLWPGVLIHALMDFGFFFGA